MGADFSLRRGSWQRPFSTVLKDGALFSGRFHVLRTAAFGGMSRIYEAEDTQAGGRVALKVLSLPNVDPVFTQRFEREIRILSTLSHPNLVRAIASGRTAEGELYLALEWLDGSDLGGLIKQGPVPIKKAIDIVRATLRGLEVVHAAGVIHRDLKPANIFVLAEGIPPENVKLLDFGVAKLVDEHMVGSFQRTLTTAGMVVGTPYYMAPEQAQGVAAIDHRADLFSLASAFYEMISGQRLFNASSTLALLVRIASEPAPSIREALPSAPDAIERLLRKALERETRARFQSAREMEEAFAEAAVDLAAGEAPTIHDLSDEFAAAIEAQRAPIHDLLLDGDVTVAPTSEAADDHAAPAAGLEHTIPEKPLELPGRQRVAVVVIDLSPAGEARAEASRAFRERVEAEGGMTLSLRGGIGVGVFGVGGAGRRGQESLRAVRAGMAARDQIRALPAIADAGLRVAVASGYMATDEAASTEEDGVELASALLEYAEPGELILDDVSVFSARSILVTKSRAKNVNVVLRAKTDLASSGSGELPEPPMVGRDAELAELVGAFEESRARRAANGVLVSGPAGIGKTRLLTALRAHVEQVHGATIIEGRADNATRAVPYSVFADALRRRGVFRSGEGVDTLEQKLDRLIPGSVAEDARAELKQEIAGLVGVRLAPERSPTENPAAPRPRDAVWSLVSAAAESGPVLLLLDDLQWSDPGSLGLALDLLRAAELPITVVLSARPELRSIHPEATTAILGAPRSRLVELGPLSREALREIAKNLSGFELDPGLLDGLAERTRGNPYHLAETLMSMSGQFSDGETTERDLSLGRRLEQVPASVHAILEGRIAKASSAARRALGAAAVLGVRFWDAGLAALGVERIREGLDELVERGFVRRRETSRFAGAREYELRSSFLRDIAYGLVPAEERRTLHARAASWLEESGEADALVLARHYEPAGQTKKALGALLASARRALEDGDTKSAASIATQALAIEGAPEPLTTELTLTKIEALERLGQIEAALRAAEQLVSSLGEAARGADEGRAAGLMLARGDSAGALRRYQAAMEREERAGHGALAAWLGLGLGDALDDRGDTMSACAQYQRAYTVGKQAKDAGLVARAVLRLARVAYATSDFGQALRLYEDAHRRLVEARGDPRSLAAARLGLGASFGFVGAYAEAERALAEARAAFEAAGDRTGALVVRAHEARLASERGDPDPAERESLADAARGLERKRAFLLLGLVGVHEQLDRGENDAALGLAQQCFDLAVRAVPRFVVSFESALGLAMSRRGDVAGGLPHAEAAVARLESQKAIEDEDPHRIYANYASCLELAGRGPRAAQLWTQAAVTMNEVAARAPAAHRASFLARGFNQRVARSAGHAKS